MAIQTKHALLDVRGQQTPEKHPTNFNFKDKSFKQMEDNILIEESIKDIREQGELSTVIKILDQAQVKDLMKNQRLQVSKEQRVKLMESIVSRNISEIGKQIFHPIQTFTPVQAMHKTGMPQKNPFGMTGKDFNRDQ